LVGIGIGITRAVTAVVKRTTVVGAIASAVIHAVVGTGYAVVTGSLVFEAARILAINWVADRITVAIPTAWILPVNASTGRIDRIKPTVRTRIISLIYVQTDAIFPSRHFG
jgi:Zn-dependent alcohol dehydrogenase